ncbi:MAG: magnesium/cobalt transporter CorA [Deltaproteobacteria bacterium]|nr:magnesium/cobalt transporter CorA [Deltaproteobacteria bacterium]
MIQILLWSDSGDWIETDQVDVLKKAVAEKTHRCWVDVCDPSAEDIHLLEELFGLHPLTLRSIQDRVDDPKIDIHDNYVFLVLHRIFYDFKLEHCELREFEVCFSDRFLITTHTEQMARTFALARQKIVEHKRECIHHGTSYLLFRILNICIRDYNPAIQEWQDALDEIEHNVLKNVKNNILERILEFKKLVAHMRKKLIPEREVLRELYESRSFPFIPPAMRPYFKVLVDNMNGVFLDLEGLRDHASSVFEVYSTMLSHEINFVMQRLTIAATIFLPLTFIVGIYGMNFDYFPELHWKGFYFVVWGFMIALTAIMLWFFRKRKWL